MTVRTVRKIGFFTALTMLLGTVVGIGIFFKNGSISRAVEGNGATWLVAWLIGGITSLAAAVSFSEIGSMEHGSLTALSAWSDKLASRKFAYFVKFNYAFFYFALLSSILGFFASEAVILFIFTIKTNNFGAALAQFQTQIPIYAHFLFGLFITLLFITINYFSLKTSGMVQVATTALKFIPILIAILVGLLLPNQQNNGGSNAFYHGSFTLKGLFAALPAVLFAYDAFLVVAQISTKVQGGKKRTAWLVLLGMMIVIALYTLLGVASILHNQGDVGSLLSNVLPKSLAKGVTVVVFGFIAISTLGVVNGLSLATLTIFQENVAANTFVGDQYVVQKYGARRAGLIYLIASILFWSTILGGLAIGFNTDAYFDGFSNFPVIFFFAIYAIVIALYSFKRNRMHTKKLHRAVFFSFAATALLLIAIVVTYSLIIMIVDFAISPQTPASWGLFASHGGVTRATKAILLFAMTGIFFALPTLNFVLKKKFI